MYNIYQMLIGDVSFSKWIDVVAVSVEAAKADVIEAYDLPVIQWRIK